MVAPDVKPTNPGGSAEPPATTPGAGGGSKAGGLGSLLGANNTAEQFLIWGVLAQLLGAALQPAITAITDTLNTAEPINPLSAESAATALARNILTTPDAAAEAANSGINSNRFDTLTALARQPLSLGLAMAGYQRAQGTSGPADAQIADLDTVLNDLGISPQYWAAIKGLAVEIPTVQQVMNAWLQGQIEEAEALTRYLAAGGDPSWFQTSYNAQGEAPTPVQALDMLNRGLIPQEGTGPDSISYHQAFLEGPWRNKWLAPFLGLRYYVPPARTVTALLKEGAITEAQATQYLQAQGLDAELTAIYIAAASHHTTVAQRELTQAQVIDAYESQLITHDEALTDLVALRFTASDAGLLLSLADKKQAVASTKQAVTRIRTLFLNGSDTAVTARNALASLGLQGDQVSNLIATWQLEKATVIRTLTVAEISSAYYYEFFTLATAMAKLQALGYSPADAQVILAIRVKGLLPGMTIV